MFRSRRRPKKSVPKSRRRSWARSDQSKSNLIEIMERFYSPIFSVCRFAAPQSKFLNPTLSAPKAQWPKATSLQKL